MEHYQNFTFFIPETGGTRVLASAQFFPHYVEVPRITNADAITIAADDLVQALMKSNIDEGNLQLSKKHYEALKKVAEIFNTVSKRSPMILQPPLPPVL